MLILLPPFHPSEIVETFAGFLSSVEIKDEPCPEYYLGRNVSLSLSDGTDFGCQFRFFWRFPAGVNGGNLKGAFQTLETVFSVGQNAFVVRNKANDLQYFLQGTTAIQGTLSGFGRNTAPLVSGVLVHYLDYYGGLLEKKVAKERSEALEAKRQEEAEMAELTEELFGGKPKWD